MPSKTVTLAWRALSLLPLLCILHSATAARAEGTRAPGFCFWMRELSDGRTHQTFLRGQRGQLVLYHALWGADGKLQECVTSRDTAVTHGYQTECQERRPQLFSPGPQKRSQTHTLFQPGVCTEVDTDAGGSTPVRHTRDLRIQQHAHMEGSGSGRVKRGLMMIPGTLWCGAGNRAANYSDLGAFPQTDECCREHDHCKYTIASFSSSYGVFNSNIFTLSHCNCDNRFKQCLQQAEDSMANVVGYGYFNLLKMRCFKWMFQMACTERTWWGRCVSSDLVPHAVIQDPTDFNSTLPDDLNLSHTTKPDSNMTTKLDSDLTTKPDSHLTTKPNSELTVKPDSDPTTTLDLDPTTKPELTSKPVSDPTTKLDSGFKAEPDVYLTTRPDSDLNAMQNHTIKPKSDQTTKSDSDLTTKQDQTQTIKPEQDQSSVSHPTILPQPIMSTVKFSDRRTNISDSGTTLPDTSTDGSGARAYASNNRTQILDHTVPLPGSTPIGNLLIPITTAATSSDPARVCSLYKFLDECRLQVPPLQELFGLKNAELRTLYHCNCAKRIAEQMPALETAGLHSLMLDFVSESCFILPHMQGTDASSSSAVLLQMPFFQTNLGWDKPRRRHLLNRTRKFRHSKQPKRRNWGVRLYRKCLRMHSRLQRPRRH